MSLGDNDALLRFEAHEAAMASAEYVLTLFVTGASDLSMRAINNVRALCEEHLHDRYQLEVIDVYRDAATMSLHDVIAAPTLLKEVPLPRRVLVGDLSDTARVLKALGIETSSTASPAQ